MKFNKLLALSSAVAMLAACGQTVTPTDSSKAPEETSSSQAPATSSKQDIPSSNGPTSSSSKPASSSSKPASSSQPQTSGFNPTFDWSSIESPYGNGRDYQIFKSAPEIRFKTDAGLNWATEPRKDTDKPEVSGTITTKNCATKYSITNAVAAMKVRGNYTTNYQKKPFRIKFESSTNMFGLNQGKKFKKWVLLADTKDVSMLRNSLGFYLGRNLMDEKLFASDFTPIHLYLNDTYWGLYILAEQKEAKPGRVEAYAPGTGYEGTDIGYLFELDHYYAEEGPDGDPTFEVNYMPKAISYYHGGQQFGDKPNGYIERGYTIGSDITNPTTQIPFIKNRVESTYTILYNACFNNKLQEIVDEKVVDSTETDVEKCLAKTIDIDSFVAAYILGELSCDPDIGYSSFYLSLDMSANGNKLMTCNCPWDFDTTFGIRQNTVENAQGLYAAKSTNMWLSMLPKLPFFQNRVKEKWAKAKETKLFERANDMISEFTTAYAAEYNKNFEKWPRTIGSNPETSFEVRRDVQQLKTHTETSAQMKEWFNKRVAYLETQFGSESKAAVDYNAYKQGATKTRLEAENSVVSGGTIKTKANDGASGDKYVGDLDGGANRSMTFTYNAAKAGDVLLTAGLSARANQDYKISDFFTITVNGTEITPEEEVLSSSIEGADYHKWTSVNIGMANMKAGANEIKFTTKSTCTNFDYIDIYSK